MYSSIYSGKEAVLLLIETVFLSLPPTASHHHIFGFLPERMWVLFLLLFCIWTQTIQFPFRCSCTMMNVPSHVFDMVECVMSSAVYCLMPYSTKNDARHQQFLTETGIAVPRILNSFWMLQGKTVL